MTGEEGPGVLGGQRTQKLSEHRFSVAFHLTLRQLFASVGSYFLNVGHSDPLSK